MEQVNWSQENMLEIGLNEPDDFLKVRETLSRMGVASRKERKLYQSCHILHKQGRYFLTHSSTETQKTANFQGFQFFLNIDGSA